MTATAARVTPGELAEGLGLRPPTPEQAAVIAAPPGPCVVIAGAGAGKTETMAARVVWLVANGVVTPDGVLGLTFTRKAAGELAQRVRLRLAQLRDRGMVAPGTRADLLAGEPTVLTYHAYAARVVAEHALRVPVEPSVRLLSEAMTWQLAEQVVRSYDDDLPHVAWTPPTVVDAVLSLAGELAEHLVDADELRTWSSHLAALVEGVPRARGQKTRGDLYAGVRELLDTQAARVELLPLVERYERRKRDRDAMDFGDQMSLAARIARRFAEVGRLERARYGVVLLDEYQDTGHAQRVLLRSLFGGGHPVTAVGDPCQSIYGWRGASAGNLTRFPGDFPDVGGEAAALFPLTVSFRNGGRVLDVANRLAEPLRARGVTVPRLRPVPAAGSGRVACALHPTAADEAAWVADEVAAEWAAGVARRAEGRPAPTAAVLVRRRAQIPRLEQALRARGLPVEVVGLGGLLDTPEVRDVVATLAVLADPTAGDGLIRLLAGARWRLGPRDLDALARRAAGLAAQRRAALRQDGAGPPGPEPVGRWALGESVDEGSIVEALDSPGPPDRYSEVGYERLRALAAELRALRSRAGQPLADLVADVERTLGLAVEVAARPDRDAATARAHLDRFLDVAADFADGAEVASLGAFLAYLTAAALREDGLEPGTVEVEPDRVQVLTVHGAKGLEWDVVAVPGLSTQVFPGPQRGGDWTRDPRALPYALRGDATDLPQLDLRDVEDQQALERRRSDYHDRCAALAALEERRLAYVAATRARRTLLCSGYRWDEATRPRGPSAFLVEIRDACVDGAGAVEAWAEPPDDDATNPLLAEPVRRRWPVDPLGPRRAAVESGAALVRAALARHPGHSPAPPCLEADSPGPTFQPTGGGGGPPAGAPASVGTGVDGPRQPTPAGAGEPSAAGPAGAGPARGGPPPRRDRRGRVVPAGQEVLFDPAVPDARTWAVEAELLLAERDRALGSGGDGGVDVPLPAHVSVTALVALRRDPAELARQIRRPVPQRPAPLTRRGTAFHAWLEERFGGERLLDLDELPGAVDEDAAPDADLAVLQDRFLASEWAHRRPEEVEVPFETTVGGVVVRGRIDAVFRDDDSGWTVVDWKTGVVPSGATMRAAEVQLAAYRLAWAELAGCPVEQVRAAFHYVRAARTVRPADLLDATGLRLLVESVPLAD